ncbi:MAG: alcohol dehydrogenase catalytic domain-containing protein [Actinobacteria bacterium]|nr:alcohol dehydrogenase catalytic domain-containing protein [Actinomycetota bacterium]
MKAAVINDYGGPEAIEIVELPDPRPGPGEVSVRVRAAALNRLDVWTLSGSLKLPIEFPHILGADAAGEIEAVGEGVRGLKAGARVLINPGISCRECERCRSGEHSECPSFRILGEHLPGTLCELVVVPALNVFPFPEELSWTEGAALGITFITAYRMLFNKGRMRPGEWVLITGIGGGLALSLLQLARPVAGRVFVTSSSQAKISKAKELGADEGIDYTSDDVGKTVRHMTGRRGVDLVLDSSGGEALDSGLRSLVQGGRLVIAGATAGPKSEINLQRLFWNQLTLQGSTMGSDPDVANMLRAVTGGGIRPIIDRSFPLAEVADAFTYLESPERFGKVAVEIS